MAEANPDTSPKEASPAHTIPSFSVRDALRVLGILGLVLGGFTFLASLILILYTRRYPGLDAIQAADGLVLRAWIFGTMTLVSGTVLWYLREKKDPVLTAPPPGKPLSCRVVTVLLVLLGLTTVLLSIHSGTYPWAAPDEVHHLNLARNVALYGSYASGHPDTGFLYFDSFDSVGPTVIGAIALVFKTVGVSLVAARLVMVAFFLLLCLASFQWCRCLFGPWSGVASVGLLVGTFSSIYLGRTVYGEVPSFAYLLLGLLAWQRALKSSGFTVWALVAGALVACAVLAKTIVVLVAFSFAGAWVYDRATFRTIRWVHMVFPVLGGVALLGLWSLFKQFHGAGESDSGGVLAIYQHYLLFGISSLPVALGNSVLVNPIAHAVWLVVAVLTVPVVFRKRYSPSAVVLYCYAVFMLYWWFFFTPGQLHRYLWNAYAILAIFTAPWLVYSIRGVLDISRPTATRFVCACAVVLLVSPAVRWVTLQSVEIATKNEMQTELEVINAIEALPVTYRVATTSGRLPGLLNFFSDRAIETGGNPMALLQTHEVVVVLDTPALRAELHPGIHLKTVGKFVLLSNAAL